MDYSEEGSLMKSIDAVSFLMILMHYWGRSGGIINYNKGFLIASSKGEEVEFWSSTVLQGEAASNSSMNRDKNNRSSIDSNVFTVDRSCALFFLPERETYIYTCFRIWYNHRSIRPCKYAWCSRNHMHLKLKRSWKFQELFIYPFLKTFQHEILDWLETGNQFLSYA